MKKYKQELGRPLNTAELDFINRLSEQNWTYIKSVTDIVREPILILDKDLRVKAANDSFYRMFQVEPRNTEGTFIYKLGNGQWNIPGLRKLLEKILPKNTFFKDFEVNHIFPHIGHKSMILNARQIHFADKSNQTLFPPLIFLAIEDISPMMAVAETLAIHVKQLASKNAARTLALEAHILKLEKRIHKK